MIPRELLVDERTGIIRRLRHATVPDRFPRSFVLVHAYTADTGRFAKWRADSAGAGYSMDGTDPAPAAVGEAVERYCGSLVTAAVERGSATDLASRFPDDAVADLSTWPRFDDSCYSQADFPFALPSVDHVMDWVAGTTLDSGVRTWVPAESVWAYYPHDVARTGGRALTPVVQAGLAAGPDREFAVRGALREVIERDAMTLAWTGRSGIRGISHLPDRITRLGCGADGSFDTRWLAFSTAFALPVVGALVRDAVTGYLSMGVSCHEAPDVAAEKALAEAFQLQLLLADYDDPDSGIGRATLAPTSPLRPFRADRRYGSSYRSDLSDVIDYGCHLQLHLDYDVQHRFEAELDEAVTGTVALVDLTTATSVEAAVAVAGFSPVVVDLTTPDVAAAGLQVVRVVVPGTLTNTAAGRPFLGSPRMRAALAGRPPRILPLPH
ncbi:YcaO-like family protein [Rhodococcus triatomae]